MVDGFDYLVNSLVIEVAEGTYLNSQLSQLLHQAQKFSKLEKRPSSDLLDAGIFRLKKYSCMRKVRC